MGEVSLDDIQLALVPVSKKSASVYKSVVILYKSIFRAAMESRIIDHNPTIYLTTKGGGVPQEDADNRKIACHPEAQSEVDRAMWFINSRKPLTCYGWRFYDKDQVKIDTFCGVFGVSRSAAAICLEQLGYLNRKKDYEYRDPLEVWP